MIVVYPTYRGGGGVQHLDEDWLRRYIAWATEDVTELMSSALFYGRWVNE